jgi:hypothetical protein
VLAAGAVTICVGLTSAVQATRQKKFKLRHAICQAPYVILKTSTAEHWVFDVRPSGQSPGGDTEIVQFVTVFMYSISLSASAALAPPEISNQAFRGGINNDN